MQTHSKNGAFEFVWAQEKEVWRSFFEAENSPHHRNSNKSKKFSAGRGTGTMGRGRIGLLLTEE